MTLTMANDTAVRDKPRRFHQYLVLTTFRRTGEAVPTTVWFAAHAGKLYVRTYAGTGKVKRVRRDGHALLTPCNQAGDARGYTVAARARILPQFEAHIALDALRRKYGWQAEIPQLIADLRDSADAVFLEITPDPGPGTADLLLETMSAAQRRQELTRAVTIGAAALVGLGGLFVAARRVTRLVARARASR